MVNIAKRLEDYKRFEIFITQHIVNGSNISLYNFRMIFRKPLSKRCTHATFSILLDCPNAKAYSRRKLQICKHQTVYKYVGVHTVCTTICDSCTISRYDGFVLHKSGKWQIGFHSILNDAKYSSIARKQ